MTDRGYARISIDRAESGSISKQRSRITRQADESLVIYADESVSGSKIAFADRPEGARLLRDLERGDRVLVTRIDRAARNVRDLLDLVERIEAAGASILFIDQAIDTAGPMGRFLLTLLGAIAELEAGMISERRKESLAAFKEEGRHALGKPPYGLQSVPNPNGRGLVLRPHPVEGPILRDVVAEIMAGASQASQVERTGLAKSPFSRLLRSERLAGVLDRTEAGPRVDPDQALFTLAEFYALQREIESRAGGRVRGTRRNASPGIGAALYCGVCGDRLYLYRSKDRADTNATYRCAKARGHEDAPGVGVSWLRADAYVEERFLRAFGGLPVTEQVVKDSTADRDEEIARARMTLDDVRAAQDRAETDDEEERLFESYRAAKKALRAAEEIPAETVIEIVATGQTFAEVWHEASDADRARLLNLVGRWVVMPGRLPIDEKMIFEPVESADLMAQVT